MSVLGDGLFVTVIGVRWLNECRVEFSQKERISTVGAQTIADTLIVLIPLPMTHTSSVKLQRDATYR